MILENIRIENPISRCSERFEVLGKFESIGYWWRHFQNWCATIEVIKNKIKIAVFITNKFLDGAGNWFTFDRRFQKHFYIGGPNKTVLMSQFL